MNSLLKRVLAFGLLGAFGFGCGSPQPTPVAQRAPGKDISAADRADKMGDNKAPAGK